MEASESLTEKGMVEEVGGGNAIVRVGRNSACAQCRSRGACEMFSEKNMRIVVENTLGARQGDWVEISVPAVSLLKISLAVYLIPILALVLGAVIGSVWAEARGMDPTITSILTGLLAMGAAFLSVRRFDRGASSPDSRYIPRMTRIMPNEGSPSPCDSK
ncbi:MAG: SoxR reducing system RseC family protein [Desulfobacteraceae bacterium]